MRFSVLRHASGRRDALPPAVAVAKLRGDWQGTGMADSGDLLLREVQEDMQREQWLRLWRSYGRYALAGVVLVVCVVAGFAGLREYRQAGLAEDGHALWQASRAEEAGERERAAALLAALAADGGGGYPFLAGLRQARMLAADGRRADAVALYDRLAAADGVEERYRQLAALYAAMLLLDEGDAGELAGRLAPLTQGPWRHSALELQGLLALRRGESAAAAAIFQALAADQQAPAALAARAAELAAIAGGAGP